MDKIKKLLLWYHMFSKRLFHKRSFIFILLLIPVSVFCLKAALKEESGIVRIALFAENKNSIIASEIIDSLTQSDSIVTYTRYDSAEKARDAVQKQKENALWIFGEDIDTAIVDYATNKTSKPLVQVVSSEDTIPIKLSNEVLFGKLFKYISYESYKNFLYENVISEDFPEDIVKEYYTKYLNENGIVKLEYLNSDNKDVKTDDFLVTPIRGILSLLIVLCGFAAAMYFLTDIKDGRYDWLSSGKRLLPACALCLSAVVISCVFVFFGLLASGLMTNIGYEFIAMIIYALAVTSFCVVLCVLFRSAGNLGAVIPFFMISMLVLCPIFFNVNFFLGLRMIFPPHYYLNAVANPMYILYMVLYSLVMFVLAFILNKLRIFRKM